MTATQPAAKSDIKLPIILMVWPAAALVGSILFYAAFNFLFGDSTGSSPLRTMVNVLLFLVGAASIVGGPVSFIVGLVMLVTRKR